MFFVKSWRKNRRARCSPAVVFLVLHQPSFYMKSKHYPDERRRFVNPIRTPCKTDCTMSSAGSRGREHCPTLSILKFNSGSSSINLHPSVWAFIFTKVLMQYMYRQWIHIFMKKLYEKKPCKEAQLLFKEINPGLYSHPRVFKIKDSGNLKISSLDLETASDGDFVKNAITLYEGKCWPLSNLKISYLFQSTFSPWKVIKFTQEIDNGCHLSNPS